MKWSDLALPWQASFEESWSARINGSIPIGAVVVNGEGAIIGRGRNHVHDNNAPVKHITLHQLAHAEINALLDTDFTSVDRHDCALYTCVEPCPLCMGAIYMSGVRRIYYAARDTYAGSTNLLGTTPYFSLKPVRAFGPQPADIEDLIVGLHVEFFYCNERENGVLAVWQKTNPRGVEFGKHLQRHGLINQWITANSPSGVVLESLGNELAKFDL